MKRHCWLLLGLALIVAGCPKTTPVEPSDAPVVTEPTCAADDGAIEPLRLVSEQASAAQFSPCGHLSYLTWATVENMVTAESHQLMPPSLVDGTKVSESANGREFSLDGRFFIYGIGEGRLSVRDLTTGKEVTHELPYQRVGLVKGTDPDVPELYFCANDTLSLLSAGTVTSLDTNVNCDSIERARSRAALAYLDKDGVVHSARFPGGEVRQIQWAALPADEGDRYSTQRLSLSPDGSLVLRQVDRFEYCGDTVCGLSASVDVASTDSTVTHSYGVPIPECCGHLTDAISFADNLGRGSLVSSFDAITFYGEGDIQSTLSPGEPMWLYRDQRRLLTRIKAPDSSYVLQLTGLPEGHLQGEWSTVQTGPVVMSASEGAFGFVARLSTINGGNSVYTVNVVRDGFLEASVSRSPDNRVAPVWVGDDGAVLIAGPVFGEGDVVDEAPFRLVDPSGALLSRLNDEEGLLRTGKVTDTEAAVLLAVVFVPSDTEKSKVERLYVVPKSGAEPFILAEARRINVSVDAAGRRLAMELAGEGVILGKLYVGAVPQTAPAVAYR